MPNEGLNTIRDLISGFNTMQMHLGLTPLSGSATGFAQAPTPTLPSLPPIKHPGEAAQEAAERISVQTRKAVEDRAANTMYGQEFGQRIAQVQSNYMAPHQAQAYAQMAGQPGFAGLPSPIHQTPPSMGIFRPGFAPPPAFATPPMVPQIGRPYMPLFGSPSMNLGNLPGMGMFAGTPPAPMFTDPYERQILTQQLQNTQNFAGFAARIPTAAGAIGTTATTMAGAGAGALLMGRLGRGGGIAGAVGALAGGIGGFMLGQNVTGPAAANLAERTIAQPLVERRAFGEQLMDVSRQFVVQGPELSPLGRGLSQRNAIQLGNRMQRDVEEGRTGGFNMRDMMRITGMAADQGMLDMAQNGEQIASQMRNVARGLQNFMRIAQEPDVRRAMQQMGTMRAMGMTIPETNIAAQNAQTFARMAGTTVPSLMQNAGLPGALTFQQMGLTAGLGMQVGMGAAGITRQAIAGGAFTPAQLALAGGQAGLQQTLTESSGAALGVNFQTMALLGRNAEGQLQIDPERLKSVMSGHVTLSQQATMAAENLQRLARSGGTSPEQVIGEFHTRINELRDELGRRLGPMGGNMLLIRQALNLRQELGGNIGLGAALGRVAPGLSTNQIRSLQLMAENPETWTGIQQQMLNRVPGMRQAESARRQTMMAEGGFSGRLRRSWVGGAGRAISGAFEGLGREWREGMENISEWWTDFWGDQETDAAGARVVRTPDRFRIAGGRERRALERYMASDRYRADVGRYGGQFGGAAAQPSADPTTGQWLSSGYGLVRGAAQILGTVKGGAVGGIAASLLPEATTAGQSDINQALRITGGWGDWTGGMGGWFARNMGWAVNIGMAGEHMRPMREYAIKRAQGVMSASQQIREGERLTGAGMKAVRRQLTENFAADSRGRGAAEGSQDYGDFEEDAVNAVLRKLQTMSGWTGDQKATEEELKKAVIEDAVKKGMSREQATQRVNINWGAGLGQIVMRRAHREGTKTTKAITASYLDEPGFNLGGKDLKEVMKKAEKFGEATTALIGGQKRSIWTGRIVSRVSDEAAKEYESFAIEASADEMLVRQAMALRQRDEEGDLEKSEQILRNVRSRLGPDKYRKLMDKVEQSPVASESLQKTLATAADVSAGMDKDEQLKRAETIRRRAAFAKTEVQIRKGAARMAEQEGTTMEAVMRRADVGTDEGRKLREKLFGMGAVEGDVQATGGRGQGGRQEERARNQADAIGQLASQIPTFKKASEKLLEGAEKLERTMAAVQLRANQPRGS